MMKLADGTLYKEIIDAYVMYRNYTVYNKNTSQKSTKTTPYRIHFVLLWTTCEPYPEILNDQKVVSKLSFNTHYHSAYIHIYF